MEGGNGAIVASVVVALSTSVHVSLVAFVIAAVRRARRTPASVKDAASRVSVLKPLSGVDDDLDENLDSFARLSPPPFEILFGVTPGDDDATAAVDRFRARHPTLTTRVVATTASAARNPKVAKLIALAEEARGEILVVSDANVRVAPDTLAALSDALRAPDVGLVTNVVVGGGERTAGAALDNLQLGAAIAPVVVLSAHGPRPLAIGKSMAMRRDDLARLGGFARVGDVLAEDHALARLFEGAGLRTCVSFTTVENRNVSSTLGATLQRHFRWMVMRRTIAPLAFLVEPLAAPAIVALLALASAPSATTALAATGALGVQLAANLTLVRVLRGVPVPLRYWPLELARPFAMLGCYLAAWTRRRVRWRDRTYVLGAGSRINP